MEWIPRRACLWPWSSSSHQSARLGSSKRCWTHCRKDQLSTWQNKCSVATSWRWDKQGSRVCLSLFHEIWKLSYEIDSFGDICLVISVWWYCLVIFVWVEKIGLEGLFISCLNITEINSKDPLMAFIRQDPTLEFGQTIKALRMLFQNCRNPRNSLVFDWNAVNCSRAFLFHVCKTNYSSPFISDQSLEQRHKATTLGSKRCERK